MGDKMVTKHEMWTFNKLKEHGIRGGTLMIVGGAEEKLKMNLFFPRDHLSKFFSWRKPLKIFFPGEGPKIFFSISSSPPQDH